MLLGTLAFLVWLPTVSAQVTKSKSEPVVGKPAPEIKGQDIDGKKFKLSDYRGKVVVLSFWATW
jgi:cytochrome oxidase Cu insertion factor (SCO1/SenC/PrrC family)